MDEVAPTTTVEQNLHTASQRRVNMVWEATQAVVAVGIVGANIAAAFLLPDDQVVLNNAFFLVIGFYFGRTNHERLGGVALVSVLMFNVLR
jgi:hypothetical protein